MRSHTVFIRHSQTSNLEQRAVMRQTGSRASNIADNGRPDTCRSNFRSTSIRERLSPAYAFARSRLTGANRPLSEVNCYRILDNDLPSAIFRICGRARVEFAQSSRSIGDNVNIVRPANVA